MEYPDNAEYRAKFIKELVECNDGADKNQSTSEEPKRAKKRKRIGESKQFLFIYFIVSKKLIIFQ